MSRDDASYQALQRQHDTDVSSTTAAAPPASHSSSKELLGKSLEPKQALNTKRSSRKLIRVSSSIRSQNASNPTSTPPPPPPPQPPSAVATMKPSQPAVQLRKSTNSLFNLFSKPKVERARGHGGEGPVTAATPTVKPLPIQPLKSALKRTSVLSPSTPPQQYHTLQQQQQQQQHPGAPPPQPTQALSSHPVDPTTRAPRASTARSQVDAVLPTPARKEGKDAKPGNWSAPPLFQAFARSVKNGLAEVTTNAVIEKTVPARPKTSHNNEKEQQSSNDRHSFDSDNSADTRRTKMTVKGSSGASAAEAQRIMVLLDDGHILQYTQHGPTNRLPERVLTLCQDSAAMTCDVASNNQVALRVVQSVAQKSFSLSSTLSRLTRRSANSKREASSLILIFSESQEMDEWMRAIRTKIADLCHPDTLDSTKEIATPVKVDSVIGELERSPQASAVSVTNTTTAVDSASSTNKEGEASSAATAHSAFLQRRASTLQSPREMSFDIDSGDDSDRKNSLEMLEEEAEKLISPSTVSSNEHNPVKCVSDSPSHASSNTTSGEHQTLNALRLSNRMSITSSATGLTSRTSSMTSEPSNQYESIDSTSMSKSQYRNLASYQPVKRRSMLAMNGIQADVAAPSVSLLAQVASGGNTSSKKVTPALPSIVVPTRAPTMSSSQALTALPELKAPELATPTITEEDERPQSILTDLPPPSTWATKPPAKNRTSMNLQPMTERQMQRRSSASAMQTTTSQSSWTPAAAHGSSNQAQGRRASQPFRLPLKVNPATPSTKRSSVVPDVRSPRLNSDSTSKRSSVVADARLGEPHVFTLEAKVDPRNQRLSMGSATYSSPDMRARSSQRLSLFPSPLLTQDVMEENKRPLLHTTQTVGPEAIPPRRASLQRPMSLQVRTDHAPFLSSSRPSNSPPSTDKLALLPTSVTAPPIRAFKPSRSASASSSGMPIPSAEGQAYEYGGLASPTDPFMSSTAFTSNPAYQVSRRQSSYVSKRSPSPASAVPPAAPLPVVPYGNSFAQQRSYQRHSYMPRSSLNSASALNLGPPAPPPNAPLPAIPDGATPPMALRANTTGSRRSSAINIGPGTRASSIPAQNNGLGIQIGS